MITMFPIPFPFLINTQSYDGLDLSPRFPLLQLPHPAKKNSQMMPSVLNQYVRVGEALSRSNKDVLIGAICR